MILRDYPDIEKFISENREQHQRVVDTAIRLVGRLKHAGKHAGGIIISDRDLFGNVPMQLDSKTGQWVSIWTEGRSTQLSKFGYLKWDMLGLKNLAYIKTCCEMIKENHGASFGDQLQGLDESDPIDDVAGYYWKDGEKIKMSLNDPAALKLANDSMTDSIFQFDTDLAKRTLSAGVRSFHDLLIFNAMGHPGPMQCVRSDSNITIDNGTKKICNLDNNKDKIAYLASNGSIKYTDKFDVVESGRKKIFRVRLKNGNELFVSGDHRFLTARGYVKTNDLTKFDRIAKAEAI
jgi:DNA polymerase III alpha subunit